MGATLGGTPSFGAALAVLGVAVLGLVVLGLVVLGVAVLGLVVEGHPAEEGCWSRR